jgi:subtilisin family serine protease
MVVMAEQADLSAAAALTAKEAKGEYVFKALRETAERTQGALLNLLDTLGVSYRAYYVTNSIAVEGNRAVVNALAANPLVDRLEPNAAITVDLPRPAAVEGFNLERPVTVPWNIAQINADAVWAMGHTGQGFVVANQDTGFQWDHPALKSQYRGWNGVTADHNFHWWDAIHADIDGLKNRCGLSSPVPCDDLGHGTHTLGTAVGDDGGANQIGVAPGARWIGCRNMDFGTGRPSTYLECFEFFLAPWDLNRQHANPALAPHVISNSWGCPSSELCTGSSLLSAVNNIRAAGILVAVAAGNYGPACATLHDEPSFFEAATTVGATNRRGVIAWFSSRGPVVADASNRIKPDLSAPGQSIRSSLPGNGYVELSGTSMATPHLVGAVALFLSARPAYSGDVEALEDVFFHSALRRTTRSSCGGVPGDQIPNNAYGWGRLDVLAAVNAASPESANRLAMPAPMTPGQTSMPRRRLAGEGALKSGPGSIRTPW